MREGEVAFLGRILAGMTHELLNVIAIISEAAGLLEDLLTRNRDPSVSWHGSAEKSLRRIRNQVSRGTELSERLNRFAHSMDEPEARVEVNDLLDQLGFLMQRAAGLKRVTLRTELALQSPVISTRPLQLQLVLAACIDQCLESTAPDGTVTLQARESDTAVAIRVEMEPERAPAGLRLAPTGALSTLRDTIDGLGASVTPLEAQGLVGLELLLVRSRTPNV